MCHAGYMLQRVNTFPEIFLIAQDRIEIVENRACKERDRIGKRIIGDKISEQSGSSCKLLKDFTSPNKSPIFILATHL